MPFPFVFHGILVNVFFFSRAFFVCCGLATPPCVDYVRISLSQGAKRINTIVRVPGVRDFVQHTATSSALQQTMHRTVVQSDTETVSGTPPPSGISPADHLQVVTRRTGRYCIMLYLQYS